MQAANQDQTVISMPWLEQIFKENIGGVPDAYTVLSYSVDSGIPLQNLNIARAQIEKSLNPIGSGNLKAELTRLSLVTISKAMGDDEQALLYQAFGEALVNLPKDLVETALRSWPSKNKFFPPLAEINQQIEEEHRLRKLKLEAIDNAIKRKSELKIAQSSKLGDLQTIWIKTKEELRKWDAFMVKQWFDPLIVSKKEGGKVTLRANSSFELEWVGTKYLDKIADAWIKIDPSTTQIEVTR